MMKVVLAFVLSLITLINASWDYSSLGLDWAEDIEECAGTNQSPINIVRADAMIVNDLPPLRKTCATVEGKFKNDNGHTLKFELADGKALFSPDECLTGGPFGDTKYFFLQFHLHWGSETCNGSEHTIDFNRFPADLHMVHVKEDYVMEDGTVDTSAAFAAPDGLAVLGLFIKEGTDDTTWFDIIADAARNVTSPNDETDSVTVHLSQIVQRVNPSFSGDFNYWHYNGSLTTPDCTEAVRWIVAEKALHITSDQMSALFGLTDDAGSDLENNFRLTQPLNSRSVYYVNVNDETESDFQSTCTCNLRGTTNFDCTCDESSGQCNCDSANGYQGTSCDECLSGWNWDSDTRTCALCDCNTLGTVDGSSCVGEDGTCDCDSSLGYSGDKCDMCGDGWLLQSDSTCRIGIELFNPTLERDNLVATFPTMGPHFVLKINLTVNSWDSGWTNIYHVTDGGNHGSTGDRYPWMGLNNQQFVFKQERNNNFDFQDLRFNPELGTKYKIEVRQINVRGKTISTILIDDVIENTRENTAPVIVENAMVYLGADFVNAGDATVEYFYLESYYCESEFYWSDSSSSCLSCDCNLSGTCLEQVEQPEQCDCAPSYSDTNCDMCDYGWLLQDDGTCRVGIELFNPYVESGKVVATLATMGENYIVKANVTINSYLDSWNNVFQIGDGGNHANKDGTIYSRYPYLGINSEDFVFVLGGANNNGHIRKRDIVLGQKYQIEITQLYDSVSNAFKYEVKVDDEIIRSGNANPDVVENAVVYLSTDFQYGSAADATVEWLYVETWTQP